TDRGLIPSTQYRYHACWMRKGVVKDSSGEVIATTMDTTSHNFSWEVDVFGEYGSYLKGVTIIDNENIWVVGALVIDDSTSRYRGQINYNLAKWNGETWSYELVGAAGVTCYDIHYFSENDIWIVAKLIYHWDGNEWVRYHLWYMDILDEDDGGVEYIWASSPANIFFVGRKGTIVHYDGSTFTKMESGTDSPIIDIWGIDENHIWATSCTNVLDDDHPDGYESVTYFFNGYEWIRKYVAAPEHHSDYSKTEIAGYMNSVWAYEDTVYISSHSGLWKESITTGKGRLDHGPDKRLDGYPFLVRGTAYNDVYAFTHWAEFLHYNGKDWYQDLSLDYFYVDDVAVKDNMVVMVGDLRFTCAVIVRGYHLP
ncbi:MAG: hypothetical protein ACP5FK_12705, partial [bacterium]